MTVRDFKMVAAVYVQYTRTPAMKPLMPYPVGSLKARSSSEELERPRGLSSELREQATSISERRITNTHITSIS